MDHSTEKKAYNHALIKVLLGLMVIALLEAGLLFQTLMEYQNFAPLYKGVMESCPCWCAPQNNIWAPEMNFSCYSHFPLEDVRFNDMFSILNYTTLSCYGGRYNESE